MRRRMFDSLWIFKQSRFNKEWSDCIDYFHTVLSVLLHSCISEGTCEGGPEGFAIGNKPCRGIEWDDIAFGMILSAFVYMYKEEVR
jgi:hypothetical protein